MNYALESLLAVRHEAEPLLRREWETASEDKMVFPFDPDWERYAMMERLNMLRFFTARRDGELKGYIGYRVGFNLHSKAASAATSDVWWVEPDARCGGVSWRLVAFAEKHLRDEGIRVIHTMTNEAFPAASRLLKFMGHRLVGGLWSKALEGPLHA